MPLYPYQETAAEWLSRIERGIVKSPAGSGKTRIATAALDRVLERRSSQGKAGKPQVTWLANTHEQCDQARKALALYPAIAARADIRIACWQSAIDLSQSAIVIADECHHFAAPVAGKILARSPLWRWGLSATPTAVDPDSLPAYFALFGKRMHTVERESVMDGGHITEARVIIHQDSDTDFAGKVNAAFMPMLKARMLAIEKGIWRNTPREPGTPFEKTVAARIAEESINQSIYIRWQLCRKFGIEKNKARNECIVQIARVTPACLILVGSIEHGKALAERIPKAVVCYAAMGKKKRREAIEGFTDGSIAVLIATSLADEGLDVPRASTLILASAGRSAAKVEQRTGRVLRLFKDKTCGMIHDFADKEHPMLLSQHKARLRLYRKLKYKFN